MATTWSLWQRFPDPNKGGILIAPFGPGCYELSLGNKKIIIGSGRNVALRMTSLLPAKYGRAGTRHNDEKRDCVVKYLSRIKYRTIACKDSRQAKKCEARKLKEGGYYFPT
jgi:hypothetical protein